VLPGDFPAAWSIGLAHWLGSASRRVCTATAYSLSSSQAPPSRTAGAFSQRLAGRQNRRPRRLQARVHPELPFADLLQPVQT
jgi:hypothetical protein